MTFDIAPPNGQKPHHIYPTGADSAGQVSDPSPTPNPSPTPIQTQTPTPSGSPDTRSTTFQAVQGGTEMRSGEALLVEAYAAIWILLMGWVLLLWRKQARLNVRLDDLERAIDRAALKAETAGAQKAKG